MSHIIGGLEKATARSLLLLDELGSGTDPLEGSALGEAILSALVQRGCSAIVTTHLGQLKTFAGSSPRAENACMEFDSGTLQPTYRLIVGTAGSSNALEIAERLGMPADLLLEARGRLDEASEGAYGQMLEQVQRTRQDSEERGRRARRLEQEAARLKEEHDSRLQRIKEQEDHISASVGLQIQADLEALLAEAGELYEEVRFSHKTLAPRIRGIRDAIRTSLERTETVLEGREPARPLQAGDEVYVRKVHRWGEISRVDQERGRALVQVGGMQMEVDLEELVPWGSTQH
jgi:DNA mismatch repair protein MutS2